MRVEPVARPRALTSLNSVAHWSLSSAGGGGAERVMAGVRVRGSKPRGGGGGRRRGRWRAAAAEEAAEKEEEEKEEGGAVLYARGVKSAEKVYVMEDIGRG